MPQVCVHFAGPATREHSDGPRLRPDPFSRAPLQIRYILFDCDNTLCQTEHLAFRGCSNLANEILAAVRGLCLPDAGMPADS